MKKLFALWLLTAVVWSAEPPFATGLEERSYEATAQRPAYSVRLSYPRTQTALYFVLKQKAEFEQRLSLGRVRGPRSLQLDYEIVYADAQLVSVYFRGPCQYGDGKTRSVQKALLLTPGGAEIKLAGEFRPGGGWIKALAEYCRAELLKKGVVDPLLSSDLQFQTVLPQADGLRVIFEEYKVAPEAYEVLVPWSVVKSEILPNGCLAFFLR